MISLIKKLAIIGSGNLATNLAIELNRKGIEIAQVYSKTTVNAEKLAENIGAETLTNFSNLKNDLDLIVVSVTDNAYTDVLEQIPENNIPIVHTAGSIPMDVFKGKYRSYGVFYPFQTFSKDRTIQFKNIPVCIEANHEDLLEGLRELAASISTKVYELTSKQREKLHLAGIISNNFSNFFYTLANKYLEKEGVEFEILLPLIEETVEKLKYMSPEEAQTGPAVRGNKNVIEKHKKILADEPQLLKLYSFVSENILEYYGKT